MVPMHMLKIMTTPNCMALIPKLCAMGRKIGVKIKMAGVMSMNVPMTSRMMFMSMNMIILLFVTDSRASEIAAGIPEYAMTQLIALDAEIRNRMIPLVFALSSRMSMKSLTVMLL